jgi:hypothetical protein
MRKGPLTDRLALAVIAAPFAIGWALVAPTSNVPVIDDWAYAGSVEHFLNTGRLVISDRSSVYPVAQILWGALFARVAGFSFVALRLSTVVLALAGCWAIYLMLRELEFSTKVSLLAALTVACYPTYFALSFTFMTDVPFVSLSAMSLLFYVCGIRRDRPGYLWWGSVFAVLAFLVRQVGVVLPLAALAAANRQTLSWPAVRRFWLPIASGLLVIVALWFALPVALGRLPVIDARTESLSLWTSIPASAYAQWNLELLWMVAFPFAPLLVCPLTRWRRALPIAGLAVTLLIGVRMWMGSIPMALGEGQTWSLRDLAMRTSLIGGQVSASGWSVRVTPFLKIISTVVVASLLVGLPSLRRVDWRAGRVLVATAVLHIAVINLIWAYYDRYYLVLVPTLAYMAAATLADSRVRTWPAAILLALWASVSITGTRDMLTTGVVCAEIARDLEAHGVRPVDIDAGYALNAWRLYVHPENLPPGADPHQDVPFVTTDALPLYRIVTVPQPGYDILRTEKLPAGWWQVTDRVYLVRRSSR